MTTLRTSIGGFLAVMVVALGLAGCGASPEEGIQSVLARVAKPTPVVPGVDGAR
ncbi:MAG: hypothetical protein H0V52_01385, partial [Acidimicrobiia bacterium]|nr:hypothetical protein [Acidimicrobiia bacterium]